MCRVQKRLVSSQSDYTQLEHRHTAVTEERDQLKGYTRQLEQVNDNLERDLRVVTENVAGFEAMLNEAYEKNALLEMEVDDKEKLQVMLQRLKDESRGELVWGGMLWGFSLLKVRIKTILVKTIVGIICMHQTSGICVYHIG